MAIYGILTLFVVLLSAVTRASKLPADEVVILIISQKDDHHSEMANNLRKLLQSEEPKLKIHLMHEDFDHPGAWTIIPVLKDISIIHGHNSSWLFICDSRTHIVLPALLDLLSHYNSSEETWIGHALVDEERTIIHHFASNDGFKYPLFVSGFAMSTALLKRLRQRLSENETYQQNFAIDAQYELAQFVWDDGKGPALVDTPFLCSKYRSMCATSPRLIRYCGDAVSRSHIYFAIKTCSKFHKDRVPVIKKTWGKFTGYMEFYSDVADQNIPTINLGVPNTEVGHCAKTMSIIHNVALQPQKYPTVKWIVITDDDTILSVSRLQELLSCFKSDVPFLLGERYGFNIHRPHGGYNYVTGGGGMVLSLAAAQLIAKSTKCQCPDISTPDDMFLGSCATRLGIPIIHIPGFHQARTEDYTTDYIESHQPISFHKHWLIDPVHIYREWFAAADVIDPASQKLHTEL
ncbi:beta-1,3-glucosyltransferase isoform X1 [Schistocerca serialis cubense]|uniref:beta-1,3-glucosyltransferase isoform X1 n=2 Tax=Schistocerca serialis cubense TaxID=2023355 RepID=UPI00214EE297|nr:beta-1,3-glucosyltransferase isoform X1 [Schistocerca serialis cubense]